MQPVQHNQFNDFHEHQLWNEFHGQSINTQAEICMYFSHIRASLWGHVSPGINGDSASVNRSRWTPPPTYRTAETKLYKQKTVHQDYTFTWSKNFSCHQT